MSKVTIQPAVTETRVVQEETVIVKMTREEAGAVQALLGRTTPREGGMNLYDLYNMFPCELRTHSMRILNPNGTIPVLHVYPNLNRIAES